MAGRDLHFTLYHLCIKLHGGKHRSDQMKGVEVHLLTSCDWLPNPHSSNVESVKTPVMNKCGLVEQTCSSWRGMPFGRPNSFVVGTFGTDSVCWLTGLKLSNLLMKVNCLEFVDPALVQFGYWTLSLICCIISQFAHVERSCFSWRHWNTLNTSPLNSNMKLSQAAQAHSTRKVEKKVTRVSDVHSTDQCFFPYFPLSVLQVAKKGQR